MTLFKTLSITTTALFVYLILPETTHASDNFLQGINSTINWATSTTGGRLSPLNFPTFINNIILYLEWIIATISTLVIIIAGFMYVTSAGNEQKTARAKNTILTAIVGLLIVFLARTIRKTVENIYLGVVNASPFVATITNIISFVLSFTAVIATAFFVYGGFTYITSAGSDEKVQRGKKILIYAALGIAVIMFSAAMVNIVIS